MKNKITIVVSIVLLVVSFLAYRGFVVYELFNESKKFLKTGGEEIFSKEKTIFNINYDNNNLPKYVKNFVPDDKYKNELSEINNLIYKEKNIYDSAFHNKLLNKLQDVLPSNLLDYKYTLAKTIKDKMVIPKKTKHYSYIESFELPGSPKLNYIRGIARYWYTLSLYFEYKNQDYETSLLLSHGIFYLVRDLITYYAQSFTVLQRVLAIGLCNNACDAILIWASRPKNQYGNLSKAVAKDILDFIKTEHPLSGFFKDNEENTDADLKIFFKHFAKGMLKNYPNTSQYKNFMYLLYVKPQKFIDKPSYEIEKELGEMDKELNKLFFYSDVSKSEPVKSLFKMFFFTEDFVATKFISFYYPNMKKVKRDYEDSLAKMEFTAIALAINSFYAEKNRLPSSIEELNSWFGQDLPKNRLTGEAYKLDLEGRHLLINKNFNLGLNKLVFDLIR